MRHLPCTHAGGHLAADAVGVLRLLDLAVCTEPSCMGIRRVGSRQRNRCGRAVTVRPPQPGDVVPGPRPAAAPVPRPHAPDSMDVDNSATQASGTGVVSDIALPSDWVGRVRKRPAITKPHVPLAY